MAANKYCEISKALSDLSSSSSINDSSEDSDYDDIFSSSHSISSRSSTLDQTNPIEGKQQKTVARLPTRRPDPNVCNRNALLARENRRKKKEYLETLEKELENMKHTNKKLHKLLKKQMKAVKKLEHEKQYFKGLLTNQSDIFNLVSVLNGKLPCDGVKISIPTMTAKASSCSPAHSNRSTSLEPLAIDCNDKDSTYEPYSEANWDQLLGLNDSPLPEEESGYYPASIIANSNTSEEHNYFTTNQQNSEEEDSGLCLHVASGKISLEYCPSCHVNAKQYNTLPDQLLVVD